MKRAGDAEAGKIISIIEKFVEAHYLMIDTDNYHVSMLQEFWDLYSKERQTNLLNNLQFYCNIMNAYHGKPVDMEHVLLISISSPASHTLDTLSKMRGEAENNLLDENDNVEPKYYYKKGTLAEYSQ